MLVYQRVIPAQKKRYGPPLVHPFGPLSAPRHRQGLSQVSKDPALEQRLLGESQAIGQCLNILTVLTYQYTNIH